MSYNILLLGETGVGKTTFLNGIANYFKYKSFNIARECEGQVVVGGSFAQYHSINQSLAEDIITFERNTGREYVCINQDPTDANITRDANVYSFKGQNAMFNVIDTPGLGDVRGIEQDKQNLIETFSFISSFSKIHAVLIFLKSSTNKDSVIFRYVLNSILSNFSSDIVSNIIFCIPKTQHRTEFGNLINLLNQHLDTMKTGIRCNPSNVFYFDNNPFRVLMSGNVDNLDHVCSQWKTSKQQMQKLFQAISEKSPHDLRDTITVNNVRKWAILMFRSASDMTLILQKYISAIEKVEKDIRTGQDSEGLLNLQWYELDMMKMPITVCTKCSETVLVKGKAHQKPRECHQVCHVDGLPVEIVKNPTLKKCCLFVNRDKLCRKCGCSWEHHKHILYKYRTTTGDDSLMQAVEKGRTAQEKLNVLQKDRESKRLEMFEIEKGLRTIVQYLKENAMMIGNDAFVDYLKLMIETKKNDPTIDAEDLEKYIQDLQRKIDDHNREMAILQRFSEEDYSTKVSFQEVHEVIKMMKNLRSVGNLLEGALVQQLKTLDNDSEEHDRSTNETQTERTFIEIPLLRID